MINEESFGASAFLSALRSRWTGRRAILRAAAHLWIVGIIFCCAVANAAGSPLQNVEFDVDPNVSTVTWSAVDTVLGPWQAQSPGSDTAHLSGSLSVNLDVVTVPTTTLQIISQSTNLQADSLNMGLPGPIGSPPLALANVAIQAKAGQYQYAVRDLSLHISSNLLTLTNGTSSVPNSTFFNVTAGEVDSTVGPSTSILGYNDHFTPGSVTLHEFGVGTWELSFTGSYSYGYGPPGVGTLTAAFSVTAHGHFDVPGEAIIPKQVPNQPVEVNVLGGASTVDGVTADFDSRTSGGILSVTATSDPSKVGSFDPDNVDNRQILQSTTIFASNPQFWIIKYDGTLNGDNAHFVVHYDPNDLPAGISESMLTLWSVNAPPGRWHHIGAVDPVTHTISFDAKAISNLQLQLGIVPEPSSMVLAGLGLVGLLATLYRRSRRRR